MRWQARLTCSALLFFAASFGTAQAEAETPFVEWHTTNIQLLRGNHYELGSKKRTLSTLEHANKWRYGDFHFFMDYTWPDEGDEFYYFEPTTRFSLSKISGKDFSYGLIKDVLISTNFEKPKDRKTRLLGGVSVDLDLPGFTFFKTNYWLRDNRDLSGSTYQFSVAWNRPVEWQGVSFLSEGFADFAGSEGTTTSHQLIVPRFLVDIGEQIGVGENRFWGGIEYSYWHNKFGQKGTTESAPQLQFKWVF